jgi:hypothetical protein
MSKYNKKCKAKHTRFVFNKLPYFFGMVNVAVIHNENASRPWVGIRKGNLVSMLDTIQTE